jgi:hypothetical protein
VEQFYSPKPMTRNFLSEALPDFIYSYLFKHDWISDNSLIQAEKLMEALKYSPIGIGVYAWQLNGEYYVRPQGAKDVHWTLLYGYKEGKYWKIFDSYEGNLKKLAWDFGFTMAKRYIIEPASPQETQNALQVIFLAFISILNKIKELFSEPVVKEEPKEFPLVVVIPPKEEPKVSKLEPFCLAITTYENMPLSYCNPGALRTSSYITSLGATSERAGFAVFPDMVTGEKALRQFVKDASEDKLKAYHDKDILGFFQSYAPSSDNNKPELYAKFVADKIGEKVGSLMKDII